MLYSDASAAGSHLAGPAQRMDYGGLLGTLIDEGLATGRAVRFCATGSSMHPAIRDGETIVVEPIAADAVDRGAVLLCRHRGRLLAHRVVAITTRDSVREFQLRGDALGATDQPVPADAIVGHVVGVWRDGRLAAIAPRSAPRDSVYHRITMRLACAAQALLERARFR